MRIAKMAAVEDYISAVVTTIVIIMLESSGTCVYSEPSVHPEAKRRRPKNTQAIDNPAGVASF